MRILSAPALALVLAAGMVFSQASTPAFAASSKRAQVEFERMTWPEVKEALAAGKTTALIYTGGVEQRGPQNANGGHNMMAYATVKAIAEKLGNAIFMPVLPFTPNNANAEMPGTIGLTNDLLGAVLERMTEQTIVNGFKNVILMGDHGGGQGQPNVYEAVAKKLDAQYAPQGVHVYYCDQVYKAANAAFDEYLAKNGYPASFHGGIPDTALMLYLDKDNTWVRRNLLSKAVGIPVVDGKPQPSADSPRNGITGDARRSTAKLGKIALDMKVDYAVKQIQGFLAAQK